MNIPHDMIDGRPIFHKARHRDLAALQFELPDPILNLLPMRTKPVLPKGHPKKRYRHKGAENGKRTRAKAGLPSTGVQFQWITFEEAADRSGLLTVTIRSLVKEKTVFGWMRKRLVSVTSLEAYIATR